MSAHPHAGLAYASLHGWLAARTWAYRDLFSEIAAAIAEESFPRDLPGALVPSSTGEVLDLLRDVVPAWWGADSNPECLRRCSERVPDFQAVSANLNRGWPFERDVFGLGVSIHALHFLRDPSSFLAKFHESIAPGGLAILAVFRGRGRTGEGLLPWLRRVVHDYGLPQAWNMLPWKGLDALMLASSPGPFHFWTRGALADLLTDHGFIVHEVRETFNGCSLLAICHKGPKE